MPSLTALAVIESLSHDGYNQLSDLTPDGGLIDGNPYNRWKYLVPPSLLCNVSEISNLVVSGRGTW